MNCANSFNSWSENNRNDDLSLEPLEGEQPSPSEVTPDPKISLDLSTPEGRKKSYYAIAAQILGWDQYGELNWETLYEDIGGQYEIGRSVDSLVVEKALYDGYTTTEAQSLLAESPYLQYLAKDGQMVPDVIDYCKSIVERCQQVDALLASKGIGPNKEFWENQEILA